jgi:hypothetical protein
MQKETSWMNRIDVAWNRRGIGPKTWFNDLRALSRWATGRDNFFKELPCLRSRQQL